MTTEKLCKRDHTNSSSSSKLVVSNKLLCALISFRSNKQSQISVSHNNDIYLLPWLCSGLWSGFRSFCQSGLRVATCLLILDSGWRAGPTWHLWVSPGSGQEQGLVGMSNASSASGGSGISSDCPLAEVSPMAKPIVNGLGCVPLP